VLGIGFIASVVAFANLRQREAGATPSLFGQSTEARLRASLDSATGELNLARAELERARSIIDYSSRYKVGADMVADIYDIALAEGIEPDLAFRLVKVESGFVERATSPVGAVGLTQLMPATARYFDSKVTTKRLYERKTNLRIGFRYLRALIREHDGDVGTALLVYNRGPVAVAAARAQGVSASNGYERLVMRGYEGKGTVD
jgi:soluble lytic murein transglycosylase-like protein